MGWRHAAHLPRELANTSSSGARALSSSNFSTVEADQLEFPGDVAQSMQLVADPESPAFSGCTGAHRERIRKLRAAILEMGVSGIGAKATAEALGVSPQVVRAVRASAWKTGELDPLKQRLGREFLAMADMLRAEAMERIDQIKPEVLLLAAAQATDKGQLLTGGATVRIVRGSDAPADLNDMIAALPVEVEAHEVTAGRVEGAQALEQKGGALEVGQVLEASSSSPAGDSVSAASPSAGRSCVSGCVSDVEVQP